MVLLFLILAFAGVIIIGSFIAHLVGIGKKAAAAATSPAQESPVTGPQQVAPDQNSDQEAAQLIVHHLKGKSGQATLLVRERPAKKAVTGQLLIVAGKKKKFVRDSFYELGLVHQEKVTNALVDDFIVLAKAKMDDLACAGVKRKSRVSVVSERISTPVVPPPVIEKAAPVVVAIPTPPVDAVPVSIIENQPQSEGAIKLRKFPSVSRGVILEIGHMPRVLGGKTLNQFGVKYRTPDGVEDVVWGVDLRTVLHDAKAGVGDTVEILKIGRKTIDEDKAPMNLYTATKLN